MSPRAPAWMTALALCGLLTGAVSAQAAAAPGEPPASVAHAKKKKKPRDKCDAIGKPCKDGDDCKPDNCKPGGEAPAPQSV